MRTLRPDQLLALEPGDLTRETALHQQFAEHRLVVGTEREWYAPAPILMSHISTVASRHETPPLEPLVEAGCNWHKPVVRELVRRPLPPEPAPRSEVDFSTMTLDEVAEYGRAAYAEYRRMKTEIPPRAIAMAILRYDRGWTVTRIAAEVGLSIGVVSRLIKVATS